jgi:uncharacterized protein with HEPN domain
VKWREEFHRNEKDSNTGIPWKEISGLRDRLIHD